MAARASLALPAWWRPQQVGGEMFPVVVKPRVVEAAGREAAAAEIVSQSKTGGLERLGLFFNHGDGGRLGDTGHHGGGGLDDAGLLVGDGGHRVAQVAFVLQRDIGDDAHLGGQQVGGVQAAAHAGLDHGPVHAVLFEQMERHGGGELEEGRLAVGFLNLADGPVGVDDFRVGHRASVDADAFVEMDQVRRGVKADGEAGRLQDAGQHGGHGPFAVGPGHMDGAVGVLGLPEPL